MSSNNASVAEPAIPDARNFDLGDDEAENAMPTTLLDDAMIRAVQEHRRKESRIASIKNDLKQFLDEKVANNIATNLVNYMNPKQDESTYSAVGLPSNRTYITPQNSDNNDYSYISNENGKKPLTIDDILIDTVHKHQLCIQCTFIACQKSVSQKINCILQTYKYLTFAFVCYHRRKESRQEFLSLKLHELFDDQNQDKNDSNNNGVLQPLELQSKAIPKSNAKQQALIENYERQARGMSLIAENLVDFLSGGSEDLKTMTDVTDFIANMPSNDVNNNNNTRHVKDRGSKDLGYDMNEEIQELRKQLKMKTNENLELNEINKDLESEKVQLLRDVHHLQDQKIRLALDANKTINELRCYIVQYQKFFNRLNNRQTNGNKNGK